MVAFARLSLTGMETGRSSPCASGALRHSKPDVRDAAADHLGPCCGKWMSTWSALAGTGEEALGGLGQRFGFKLDRHPRMSY